MSTPVEGDAHIADFRSAREATIDGMVPQRLDVTETDIGNALGAVDEVELLGRGTYGSTFRVVSDDDEFAIKVMHLVGMPPYLWERELEALRRIDHPNVMSLKGSGTVVVQGQDLPFLTCEYVDGGNLRKRVTNGELPEDMESIRQLLTGLLAGVAEIHDLGGLHRDIKPENVALRGGEWGRPVLLDFGLVRLADMSSHTQYPAWVGTLAYMAPEQLRGKPARTRSDLFAIGVTVYEVGTGQHPFAAGRSLTVQELHGLMSSTTPQRPEELSTAFDEALGSVVMRLLSFRAHERLSVETALRELAGRDAD